VENHLTRNGLIQRGPLSQAEDSHNLLPVLKGTGEGVRTSLVHSTWERTGFGIRQGDWVLINAKTGYSRKPKGDWEARHGYVPDAGNPVELYNLKEDIGQRRNVAETHPERVHQLQELLKEIRGAGTK
jgi:arylsulfatase A